jgi:hypothetical protein
MLKRSLALVALLACAHLAQARRIAPPPISLRAAQSEAVFVGKVTAISDKMVPAELEKGDDRQMQVATVTVSSDLLGRVGKNIEVGFFPGGGRLPGVSLAKDANALFFARKHPTKKNTYVAEMFYSVVTEKDNPDFKSNLDEAKRAATIFADPLKALRSKTLADRQLAASLLVVHYKTPVGGGEPKSEAVPAEVSKLILEALSEADWRGEPPGGFQLNPQGIFARLGATAADGWTPPKDFTKFPEEAKKWMKENAGKFKMTRYARPEMGKPVEP